MTHKTVLAFAILLSFSYSLVTKAADEVLSYEGSGSVYAEKFHKKEVSLKIRVFSENGTPTRLQMTPSEPMMGLTELKSKEFGTESVILINQKEQLSFYFKIQGAPHQWYFVLILEKKEDKKDKAEYTGHFYRVQDGEFSTQGKDYDSFKSYLKLGVEATPEAWKKLGDIKLSKKN